MAYPINFFQELYFIRFFHLTRVCYQFGFFLFCLGHFGINYTESIFSLSIFCI